MLHEILCNYQKDGHDRLIFSQWEYNKMCTLTKRKNGQKEKRKIIKAYRKMDLGYKKIMKTV